MSFPKLRHHPASPARAYHILFLASVILWAVSGCALLDRFPLDGPGRERPSNRDAHTRGMDYYEEGFFNSAVEELKNVPSSHLDFKQAQISLARSLQKVAGANAHAEAALRHQGEGRFLDAKRELEKALEIYPRHRKIRSLLEDLIRDINATADLLYGKGRDALERLDYESARVSFLEALRFNPRHDPASFELSKTNVVLVEKYYQAGLFFSDQGKLDRAIEVLERAYQIDSVDPGVIEQLVKAYNLRALKFYREENLGLAVRDLERSLKMKFGQVEILDQLEQVQDRIRLLKKIDP